MQDDFDIETILSIINYYNITDNYNNILDLYNFMFQKKLSMIEYFNLRPRSPKARRCSRSWQRGQSAPPASGCSGRSSWAR